MPSATTDALRRLLRLPAPPRLDSPALQTRVALPARPGRPSATVVASAARILPENAQALRAARQRWQADAWTYRDAVPEVRYAHNFLGNATAQVRMYPAQIGEDGDEPLDFDDPDCTLPPDLQVAARAAMARLTGNAAGHGAILSPVVQNFETVGECQLLGFTDMDSGQETWSIRSMDELRVTDAGYFLTDSATTATQGRQLPDDSYVARLWSPHPRFSAWPDSPMRALLDVCEELLLAGRERRAALRSRIAGNGILKVPNELLTVGPPDEPGPPEDAGAGLDEAADPRATKFMADLTLAMTTPIGDETSPSALVPLLVRGPAEALAALGHFTLDRPGDQRLSDAEEKALRRLGTGLDVPPEIISGLSDVNHWTAWQIDTSTWTHHVEPITAAACAALTIGYLRATLEAMGRWPPDLISQVVIWYDPRNLVHDPRAEAEVGDTGYSAEELYRLATLAQVLISAGFDPAGVLELLALPAVTYVGAPAAPVSRAPGRQPPPGEQPPEEQPPPAIGGPPEEQTPPPAEEAPAAPEPAAAATWPRPWRPPATAAADPAAAPGVDAERLRQCRRLMDIDRGLRERLVGACDAALARVLERAGNRVRTAAARRGQAGRIDGLSGPQVAAALGPATVAALGLDEAELLADEYARLRSQFTEWTDAAADEAISTCIRMLGADSNSERISRLVNELHRAFVDGQEAGWVFLQDGLADVAEAHLYHPEPDVPDLGEVPDALVSPSVVRAALAHAGGLHTAIAGLTRDGLPGARNVGVGGIGTGELLGDFMRQQGAEVAGYEWAYGISSRHFEPHRALDGTKFDTWGTPPLATAGTGGEWVGDHFAPGDHKGCHCDYMPIWADGERQAAVAERIAEEAGGRAADAEQARLAAGRAARAARRAERAAAREQRAAEQQQP